MSPVIARNRPTSSEGVPGNRPMRDRWYRRLRSPYFLVAAILVVCTIGLAVRRPWGIDFWVHATAVERLSTNLLAPGGLQITGTVGDSSYYSPYTVLLAVISQTTGLSAVAVLSLVSPLIVALFCYAFWRFCRLFRTGSWFTVMALGVVLTLWGVRMWAWSGFLSVFSLPVTLPLPSTVASAFMLLLWALLAEALARSRWSLWGWITLAATAIVLTHQLTAVNTAIGCLAILVWRWHYIRRSQFVAGLVSMAVVIGAVATWPYYSVWELLGSPAIDSPQQTLYTSPLWYQGLVLLSIPALWSRWRADRRDVLVLMTAIAMTVVVFGGVTGNYTYVRMLAPAMLAAQIAVAVTLHQRWRDRAPGWRVWRNTTVVACLGSLLVNGGNVLYALPPAVPIEQIQAKVGRNPVPADYSWLSGYLSRGDVVITNDTTARRIITAYGFYTVMPGWEDPVVPDTSARVADVALFFNPDTDVATKARVTTTWSVSWVLLVPDQENTTTGLGTSATLVTVGPDGQRLYAVQNSGD